MLSVWLSLHLKENLGVHTKHWVSETSQKPCQDDKISTGSHNQIDDLTSFVWEKWPKKFNEKHTVYSRHFAGKMWASAGMVYYTKQVFNSTGGQF